MWNGIKCRFGSRKQAPQAPTNFFSLWKIVKGMIAKSRCEEDSERNDSQEWMKKWPNDEKNNQIEK